ncbi:MAG: hypothetical protein NT069_34150, partial [Planctomycetota bacterium]|nr:hypothetical protein [Planctomycetota bacterium]
SRTLGLDADVFEELATVAGDCREPDWDGYGAAPVSQETLRTTYRLLESLPLCFPPPSIGAEPDGQLALEWHHSRRRTLSVSVSPLGDLHYAGLFGPNRVHGTEVFFDELPESIAMLIRRVYPIARISLRRTIQ